MAQPRQWTIHPDESGEVNRDLLARTMLDAAVIVAAMGGAIIVTTRREEDPDVPGEFFTTHAVVRWVSKGSYTERHLAAAGELPAEEIHPAPEEEQADALAAELPEGEPGIRVMDSDANVVVRGNAERNRLLDPDSTEIPEDIPSGAEILAAAGE